jgi:hypothetical protein
MQCIIGNNNTHSNEYFGCAFTPGDICQQFTREMFDLYQGYALYRNWAFDLLNYTHFAGTSTWKTYFNQLLSGWK